MAKGVSNKSLVKNSVGDRLSEEPSSGKTAFYGPMIKTDILEFEKAYAGTKYARVLDNPKNPFFSVHVRDRAYDYKSYIAVPHAGWGAAAADLLTPDPDKDKVPANWADSNKAVLFFQSKEPAEYIKDEYKSQAQPGGGFIVGTSDPDAVFKNSFGVEKAFDKIKWGNAFKNKNGDPIIPVFPQTLVDLKFDYDSPFSYKQIGSNVKHEYVKLNVVYQHYHNEYENGSLMLKKYSNSERNMPNIYMMLHDRENLDYVRATYGTSLTPSGQYALRQSENFPSALNLFGYKLRTSYVNYAHMHLYVEPKPNYTSSPTDTFPLQTKENIIFTDSVSLLKGPPDEKKHFPFYVDIEFSTEQESDFMETVKQTGTTKYLANFLINGYRTWTYGTGGGVVWVGQELIENQTEVHFNKHDNVSVTALTMGLDSDTEETIQTDTVTAAPYKVWDLRDWLGSQYLPGLLAEDHGKTAFYENANFIDGKATFLKPSETYPKAVPKKDANEISKFSMIFGAMILRSKLQSLYTKHKRAAEDFLTEQPAHSEILFYKIVKKDEFGNILQNIWVPNFKELNIVNYCDTQVVYDKTYSYEIKTYNLVLGTEYYYANLGGPGTPWQPTEYEAKEVVTSPACSSTSIHGKAGDSKTVATAGVAYATMYYKLYPAIVEAPFQDSSLDDVTIIDNPPLPPEVTIIPYRAVKNKFVIALNDTVGEIKAKPIMIEDSDEAIFDKVFKSQGWGENAGMYGSSPEKMLFRSDDFSQKFQVFKIDKKPTSYKDFKGTARLVEKDSFIEKIKKSNKKYYYTFRTIDRHGYISNPSPVYRVELVDNSPEEAPATVRSGKPGRAAYIEVTQVDFEPEIVKLETGGRKVRKYIQIKPAIAQQLVEQVIDAEDDEKSEVILGHLEKKMWNKQYKMIIRSKKTGKQINVYFEFKQDLEVLI